jgi:hypothetical protein
MIDALAVLTVLALVGWGVLFCAVLPWPIALAWVVVTTVAVVRAGPTLYRHAKARNWSGR